MDPRSPDPEHQWCSGVTCNMEDQEFMEDLVSLPTVSLFSCRSVGYPSSGYFCLAVHLWIVYSVILHYFLFQTNIRETEQ